MLKLLNKNINYFKRNYYNVSRCTLSTLNDKVNSLVGRENKLYILSQLKNSENFIISDILAKFYKMNNKTVINPILKEEENKNNLDFDIIQVEDNQNSKNILNFLLENGIIYTKINKDEIEYYINLKNSKYINLIEKDEIKLKSIWPSKIISSIKKFMQKKTNIKIKFNLINEIEGKNYEVGIDVKHPEFLFGVTFITLSDKNSDIINSLNLSKIISEKLEKNDFILPSKIFAINPINNEKIPILFQYNSDEVIRACTPAHNLSDFELAQENKLQIKFVAKPINKMSEAIFNKKEDFSSHRNKSIDKIKQEILNNKLEGPLIVYHNEAFLINCKEFDFLYLDEARKLIVNNLISKRKAERQEEYSINDWLVAKQIKNDFIFDEIFKNSIKYLNCVKDLNIEIFKKILPVDILLIDSKDNLYEDCSKFFFYSQIIHRIFLDLFNFKIEENPDIDFDKVYINKEQELENDILFPAPYKNIIMLKQNLINQNVLFKNLDFFRLFILLKNSVNSNFKYDDEILNEIKLFFVNLKEFQEFVKINTNNIIIDVDLIRDEMINLNEESQKDLMILIFKNIQEIIELIKQNKLIESFNKIKSILYQIKENSSLFQNYPNLLFYIYLDFMMIIYPYTPETSNSNWGEIIMKINTNKFKPKENINEYSIESLNLSCNNFIQLMKATTKLEIYINEEKMGSILIDTENNLLQNKTEMIKYINDYLNIKLDEDNITEYRNEDQKLYIKINKLL